MQLFHRSPDQVKDLVTEEIRDLPHHGYYHENKDFMKKDNLQFGIYSQRATGIVDWFYDGKEFYNVYQENRDKNRYEFTFPELLQWTHYGSD